MRSGSGRQGRAATQPVSLAGKHVATELDGMIAQSFNDALRGLQDDEQTNDGRVHGTRKHLKRLRALARLLDALEKERLSDADRFALRVVARSLGRVRAPAAELAAWRRFATSLDPARAAVVDQLLEKRRPPATRVQRRLQRSERALAGLKQLVTTRQAMVNASEEYDHDAFLRNLRRGYHKCRRALRRAQAAPGWQRLHALRRASKYHRYQLQFLELFFAQRIKPERSKVARLADKLGEHHDLGGIQRYLTAEATFQQQPGAPAMLKQLRRRIAVIETRCLELAGKSFRERPGAFEARIRRYFDDTRLPLPNSFGMLAAFRGAASL